MLSEEEDSMVRCYDNKLRAGGTESQDWVK